MLHLFGMSEKPPDQPPPWFNDREARDRRILFLQDWDFAVRPQIESAHRMVEHSVRYGSNAIQAAYVLNGGALAALPPLMQGIPAASRSIIPYDAALFVLGIAFAALASLNAYLNFQFNALQCFANAEAGGQGVWQMYGGAAQGNAQKKYNRTIYWTMWLSIVFALASIIAFVAGVCLFIGLASASPAIDQRAERAPAAIATTPAGSGQPLTARPIRRSVR